MSTTTAPATAPKNPAAQALGRLGGSANTAAQRRQRRAAAKNAGRPRRVCIRCAQPVVGGHADRALDLTCGAHGWRWEQAGRAFPAPPSERQSLDRVAAVLAEWRTSGDERKAFNALRKIIRHTGRAVPR
jgi:hypothetical protein